MSYKGIADKRYTFSGMNAANKNFIFGEGKTEVDDLDAFAALLTTNAAARYDATLHILKNPELLKRELVWDGNKKSVAEYCLKKADSEELINKALALYVASKSLASAREILEANKSLSKVVKGTLLERIDVELAAQAAAAELKALAVAEAEVAKAAAKALADEAARIKAETLERARREKAEAARADALARKAAEEAARAEAAAREAAAEAARIAEAAAKEAAKAAELEALLKAVADHPVDPEKAFALAEWYQNEKNYPQVGHWLQQAYIRASARAGKGDELNEERALKKAMFLLHKYFFAHMDFREAQKVVKARMEVSFLDPINWEQFYADVGENKPQALEFLVNLANKLFTIARPDLIGSAREMMSIMHPVAVGKNSFVQVVSGGAGGVDSGAVTYLGPFQYAGSDPEGGAGASAGSSAGARGAGK